MGGVCFLKRVRTSCPSRRNASADSATPLLASRRAATLTVFPRDRKSTRLNSSHSQISYAVFCLKKKNARHEVHALTHQLGDEKPALEFLQHAGEVRSLGAHHEVVVTASIAGGFQAQRARRIASEEIAFDDAAAHDGAAVRRNAFLVERRARHLLLLVRALIGAHQRREHLSSEAVDEER